MKTRDDLLAELQDPNVQAFLRVIRAGEGTSGIDGYRTLFGGKKFETFDAHPNIITTASGYTSTAAGAYQFLAKTWKALVEQYHFPNFGPQCQDEGAVALIIGRGALQAVKAGKLAEAITLCNREWASLPGSPYGQPTRTMEQATKAFLAAGGLLFANSVNPVNPSVNPKEAPMAPLLLPLAGALIDIFTPLAKEKITKEMARHTDSPGVAEQIANSTIAIAQQVTGLADPVSAVAEAKKDAELAKAIEAKVLVSVDQVLAAYREVAEIDRQAVKEAREFNTADLLMLDTKWVKFKFIHVLSIAFVSFCGWFVTRNWDSLTPELKGAVITLMIIAGWNGVRDYWMGSSSGSAEKTQLLTK